MKELSVIIPLREGASPETTLRSLATQTYQDFDIVISQDEVGNANWARNRGFELSASPFVLFCDDDIQWLPDALGYMVQTLKRTPAAAYVYGAYRIGDRLLCDYTFNAELLKRRNFISTMSVLRREKFYGFDESLERLQDWDLWLNLLHRGETGVYCGEVIFETAMRTGITYGGGISYKEAEAKVQQKYEKGVTA